MLVFDPDGRLRDRWGRDLFTKPHGIWVDSRGDLYVSEVLTENRLQKFVRV